MARGTVTLFEEYALDIGKALNLSTAVLKMGIVDNTSPPTAADATPTWSDYSANEVSTGGNYTADGVPLTTVDWSEAAGVATLDFDDVNWAQNGSGFADGEWAIIYDATTDVAIAFVELATLSEVAGPIEIAVDVTGFMIATVT